MVNTMRFTSNVIYIVYVGNDALSHYTTCQSRRSRRAGRSRVTRATTSPAPAATTAAA